MALVAVLGGCGGVHKGDEQIRSTAREVLAAMGVADRMVEYAYDVRNSNPGCASELGLEADDAWWARRAYAIGPGSHPAASPGSPPLDPPTLYGRALDHLRGSGWTIQEFEGQYGGAPAFVALKDDESLLYFGANSQFSVTVGPCARTFTGLSAPQYVPVPQGRFTVPNPPKPPLRTPGPPASS